MPVKTRFLEPHYTSRMVRQAAERDVTLPPPPCAGRSTGNGPIPSPKSGTV